MCLICVQYSKGLLSADEAYRNLREVEPKTQEDFEHKEELRDILFNDIGKQYDSKSD